MTDTYAMRVMNDTTYYAAQNAPVSTLTRTAERQGWDTPISGDMLRVTLNPNPTVRGESTTARVTAVGNTAPGWGTISLYVKYVNEDGKVYGWYPDDEAHPGTA